MWLDGLLVLLALLPLTPLSHFRWQKIISRIYAEPKAQTAAWPDGFQSARASQPGSALQV
jgi:hypothetical protein